MTREDALDRVQKLLNRTTANGCTEAEATVAAGQAQKLMLKHNIEALDLDTEEDEEIRTWEDPLDVMPNRLKHTWRGQLAMVICRHNGSTVFWGWAGWKPKLTIAGRASDVTTTRYLYNFVVREMERMVQDYRGNGRTWLNNWRLGVVDGIAVSLREARRAARSEYASETGTALIVVDQALVTLDARHTEVVAWAQKKYNLRRGGGDAGRWDYGARATGKCDGKTINVNGGTALPNEKKRLK